MRRLVSILLLAIFGLPFVSPLFASTAKSETNLPACCRRAGRHHCGMAAAEKQDEAGTKEVFVAPLEKCPYAPAAIVSSHNSVSGPPASAAIFAEVLSASSVHAQTESKWRIARDRSRNKRGPPTFLSL